MSGVYFAGMRITAAPLADDEKNQEVNQKIQELVKKAHITVSWLGARSPETIKEIVQEIQRCVLGIEAHKKEQPENQKIEIVFDDWSILGKPADIAANKGLNVRLCHIYNYSIFLELVKFHQKWYKHEVGEAEERRHQLKLHLTCKNVVDEKPIMDLLNSVECLSIFVKEVGGDIVWQHTF
jgi:hypothetical protein